MKEVVLGLLIGATIAVVVAAAVCLVALTKPADVASWIKTVEYRGCEYVYFINNGGALTHKGNCRFCLERTPR